MYAKSKKKKSFRENYSFIFAFQWLAKRQNFSRFSQKQMRKFLGKQNAKILREIINYDIIELLLLSSQSRDFHKFLAQLFVAATKRFPEIRFAKLFSAKFRVNNFGEILHRFSFFAFFIFAKKFAKYNSKRSLETLYSLCLFSVSLKARERFKSVGQDISDPYYEIRDIVVFYKMINNQILPFF